MNPSLLALHPSRAAIIDELAAAALLDELACYPKSGLVSFHDRGSHADMDAATFIASMQALRGYFSEIAQAGARGADFAELNRIGTAAEQRMLEATGGINTHRGAIFSMGLLSAAAGHALRSGLHITPENLCSLVAERWGKDMLAINYRHCDTNGAKVRARFAVAGAREHAAQGFPVLRRTAEAMKQAFNSGLDRNWAGVHAFLTSVSLLDDTNILHRGGVRALWFVQASARDILQSGGSFSPNGREMARALHRALVSRWLSPGGSADMLALAYFLISVEQRFGQRPE